MYTVCCEAIFNRHPDAARSALVGVGPPGVQVPAIVVEPLPGKNLHRRLARKVNQRIATRWRCRIRSRRRFATFSFSAACRSIFDTTPKSAEKPSPNGPRSALRECLKLND